MTPLKLRAGDWVEVRSKSEILATLDKQGQLDGLPFMPEMFQYCGKRLRVYKRAHKTCDTVNGCAGLRVASAIHLEGVRCDGQAHGGCQAECLVFWKEAWLKRAGEPTGGSSAGRSDGAGCSEQDVVAATILENTRNSVDPTYVCQATRLPFAATPLKWWDLRQYVEDFRSGNVGLGRLFSGLVYSAYYHLSQAGIGLGPAMRWFYDKFQGLRGGVPFPRRTGTIPVGQPTPTCTLNLQPGEWVRVKSHPEILATLNAESRNRGLYFDAEAVPYCGGTYRVRRRLNKIVDEKTGKLVTFKNDSIVLEGVFCQARYSDCRMFCPRAILSYWREIWLERVPDSEASATAPARPAPEATPRA
jgi:hypothetical protein